MQAPFALTSNPHATATSTGTSNQQTLTPPSGAKGFFYTLQTNGAYVTFDGSVPSSSNGLHFMAGSAPVFIPMGKTLNFVSDAAGNAVLSVMWCG